MNDVNMSEDDIEEQIRVASSTNTLTPTSSPSMRIKKRSFLY